MASLDFVVRELNPVHDMEIVEVAQTPIDLYEYSLEENLLIAGARVATMAKPLLRGCIVGGAVGSLASMASGNDVGAGAAYGAVLGGLLDNLQFYARAYYSILFNQKD